MTTIVDLSYKSFEGKLSSKLLPEHMPLGLGLGLLARVTDLNTIKATKAAIEYFTEQAREKIAFVTHEKENQEFWEAVHNFTSYPDADKYTLPVYWQECLVSVWEDQCKENSFLEKDCRHGYDCKKINNCSSCTPYWEVKQNEEKQAEQYRLKHFHKHKSTKQKKKEVARY